MMEVSYFPCYLLPARPGKIPGSHPSMVLNITSGCKLFKQPIIFSTVFIIRPLPRRGNNHFFPSHGLHFVFLMIYSFMFQYNLKDKTMKTAGTARKKVELRERFLKYAQEHAVNDRIPTVAEFRKALGVTNYMLLDCMNGLIKEGQLYRKSRKEGTFLSWHQKKCVIGLFDTSSDGKGFVDSPAWMSGFFRAFTKNEDCLLRIVPSGKAEKLPEIIRQFGFGSIVWFSNQSRKTAEILENLPKSVWDKIIFTHVNFRSNEENCLPSINGIGIDHDFWAREYVRAALLRSCRNFLMISPPDRICETMQDEMRKQGLQWHPECLISDPDELPKKLPDLVRKYQIDAVRCAGGMQHSFALAVKDMPGFRPFMPVFGSEQMYRQMKKEYPWLNAYFIFEHMDDFLERFGFLAGKAAIELAETGKPFVSKLIRMNYSKEYKAELKNRKG